ncbi:TonB-dependent receptor [Sulfidibacter corallicola]|uniref:TonB-dependent receptor n=1 Tax=Sulfidibacter corallicola TaxID=2818388 RepID=A0A8A4U4V1_SULCO|nr:TonB-dependent receptor [Sulfidibacter corallicola]QTD53775.1 TonB-dependent receptor [Sulfidibacter corallicola]
MSFLVLTFLFLWSFLPLKAQTTSTMFGEVRQGDGDPLPGVLIRAESTGLIGQRIAVSDANGHFVFVQLPPGSYELTATLAGMQTLVHTVEVSLNQVARPILRMSPQEIEESLKVVGSEMPVLDTLAITANYDNDLVDRLPVDRDQAGTALLAPGVTDLGPGGNVQISGAPSFENLYLVDGGVANFDNIKGEPTQIVIEDAIQETTVLTGSISAEFGQFAGGLVNTITKSGSNTFEGSLRFSFFNEAWREENAVEERTNLELEDDLSNLGSLTLGGPIIKDRLWFFVAARRERDGSNTLTRDPRPLTNEQARELMLPPDQRAPSPQSIATDREDDRFEIKLSSQIAPGHDFVASYLSREQNDINVAVDALHISAIPPLEQEDESLLSLNYRGRLNDLFSVELWYTDKQAELRDWFPEVGPGEDLRIDYTPIQDINGSQGAYQAPFTTGPIPEERDNRTFKIKFTYLWHTENIGLHQLTAGYQDYRDTRLSNNQATASGWSLTAATRFDEDGNPIPIFFRANPVVGLTRISFLPIEQESQGSDFIVQSAFINDEWFLGDSLRFNIGVRYDRNDATAQDGSPVADDDRFSPRLAVRYHPGGKRDHTLSAGFARYNARLADVAGSASLAGRASFISWVYDGPRTESIAEVFQWFDENIGDPLSPEALAQAAIVRRQDADDPTIVIADDLTSPIADEWTLGYARSWGQRGHLKFDYVFRDYQDYYATFINLDTGTNEAGTADRQVIDNDPGFYKREYHAVQVQGQWQFSRSGYLGGSYTWSQTYGNSTPENRDTGSASLNALTIYPEFNSFDQRAPNAYLPEDLRHNLKAWLSYSWELDFGLFNTTLFQTYRSGLPYGAFTDNVLANGDFGFPPNPGYINPPFFTRYFFDNIGTHRTDSLLQTDVALNLEIPLQRIEFFLRFDILNLFNGDATHFTSGLETNTEFRKPWNVLTDTPNRGEHWEYARDFGEARGPESLQSTREFRFDVGLRF